MSEPEFERDASIPPIHVSGLLRSSAPIDEHDGRSPGATLDPTLIDRHVGSWITKRREALNISMASLARSLAVSLRVMSAYETGTIRVGGDRLLEIATYLSCAPSFFFQNHVSLDDARTPYRYEDQRTEILEKYLVVLDSLMISNLLKNMYDRAARLRIIDYAIEVSKGLDAGEAANHAKPDDNAKRSSGDAEDGDGRV